VEPEPIPKIQSYLYSPPLASGNEFFGCSFIMVSFFQSIPKETPKGKSFFGVSSLGDSANRSGGFQQIAESA
jgi:hypothetical protein